MQPRLKPYIRSFLVGNGYAIHSQFMNGRIDYLSFENNFCYLILGYVSNCEYSVQKSVKVSILAQYYGYLWILGDISSIFSC